MISGVMGVALIRITRVVKATKFTQIKVCNTVTHFTLLMLVILESVAHMVTLLFTSFSGDQERSQVSVAVQAQLYSLIQIVMGAFLQVVIHNMIRPVEQPIQLL